MHWQKLTTPQTEQPRAFGSDPDCALAVVAQAGNWFSGQLGRGADSIQISLLPDRQPGFRANPKPPLSVLRQRIDGIRRESVFGGEGGEFPLLQPDQAPAHAPDPQRALIVP